MTAVRLRALVALFLCVATVLAAHAWRPTQRLADTRAKVDLEVMFPKQFGEWTIDTRMPVQLVSPDQQAVLDAIYNQTLSRTYVNREGQRVMLSVAYGGDQSDGTRAHRPEVCYPAQGFQILSAETSTLSTPAHPLRVKQLIAKQGGRTEPITYWVVVGERVVLSGSEQKLAQLRYSTRGIVPDGMLVRLSTIDTDATHAYAVHQQFLAGMVPALQRELRAQVIGSGGA